MLVLLAEIAWCACWPGGIGQRMFATKGERNEVLQMFCWPFLAVHTDRVFSPDTDLVLYGERFCGRLTLPCPTECILGTNFVGVFLGPLADGFQLPLSVSFVVLAPPLSVGFVVLRLARLALGVPAVLASLGLGELFERLDLAAVVTFLQALGASALCLGFRRHLA